MSILQTTYPTRQLGKNGPFVSAIGFGAMAIQLRSPTGVVGQRAVTYGSSDPEETYKTLTYAADRGITFWDTSDAYGTSEEALGQWFKQTGRRSDIFLATKFGGRNLAPGADPYKPNSKPTYIRSRLHSSLKALQTEYIDLYYQHRVDPEVPIEVVLETLREFIENGQIRWIGLSECSIEVLERAKAVPVVGEKVVAVQMEYSVAEIEHEKSGFVQKARDLGVSVVAYSPLCRGLLSGRYKSRADFDKDDIRLLLPRFSKENFSKNLVLTDKIAAVARKLDSTPSQVAHTEISPAVIPIPGSRSIERLEENAKGAEVTLSEEDVKEIRKLAEEADIQGDRYHAASLRAVGLGCIPLSEWKGEN